MINLLVNSVCVLSPVSDVLSPPNVLLAAIWTPLWKNEHIQLCTLKTHTQNKGS